MADPWLGGVFVLGLVTLALQKNEFRADRRRHPDRRGGPRGEARRPSTRGRTHGDQSSAGSGAVQAGRRRMGFTGPVDHLRNAGGRRRCTPRERLDRHDHAARHVPRGLDDPLVARSRELKTVQNFLAVARRHVRDRDRRRRRTPAGLVVGSSILRSRWTADRVWPPWAPADLGSGLPVSCTLWFGGEFDPATGRPTASIVYVGHLVQRRPIR